MNLIVNAFAFKENYGASMQLGNRSDMEKLSTYMKNLVVSLISAKKNNPDDEVMLIATDQPFSPYNEMLADAGVKVRIVPFDTFVMPKEFPWALAFYKLCVLKELSKTDEYEKILLIDTDTFTVKNYSELWSEASHGIVLYDISHSYDHPDRAVIKKARDNMYAGNEMNIVHYGGEFYCGRPVDIRELMNECSKVFEDVEKSNFDIPKESSDEVILSIAAAFYASSHRIIHGGAYIFRYWTENLFYLVSTNHTKNPVCVWHFPVEKDTGIVLLFNYYQKHKSFPDAGKAGKMLGMNKAKRPFSAYRISARRLLADRDEKEIHHGY